MQGPAFASSPFSNVRAIGPQTSIHELVMIFDKCRIPIVIKDWIQKGPTRFSPPLPETEIWKKRGKAVATASASDLARDSCPEKQPPSIACAQIPFFYTKLRRVFTTRLSQCLLKGAEIHQQRCAPTRDPRALNRAGTA